MSGQSRARQTDGQAGTDITFPPRYSLCCVLTSQSRNTFVRCLIATYTVHDGSHTASSIAIMAPPAVKGRFLLFALFVIALFLFVRLESNRAPPGQLPPIQQAKESKAGASSNTPSGASLTGHAIAPKLGNATAKYVLKPICNPHA